MVEIVPQSFWRKPKGLGKLVLDFVVEPQGEIYKILDPAKAQAAAGAICWKVRRI